MQEKDNYILVLGSKPNSFIPNIKADYVYAANGAAEMAAKYKVIFPETKIVSVVTAPEFEKNMQVQTRVLDSVPDYLVSRFGFINLKKYNFKSEVNYINLSNLEQLKIQSKFFKYNIIDIVLNEMHYEDIFLKKFIHLFNSIRYRRLIGASTGFFSILYALMKHPEKKIIISGIGMIGGSHYYNEKSNRYTKRSFVDRKLVLNLKKYYKTKIITTDKELSTHGNINLWNNEVLDL